MSPKVTIVSNFNLETGRGPVFRLVNILPILNRDLDLNVISLQEPDRLSVKVFKDNGIPYKTVCYDMVGWFVQDSATVAERIANILVKNRSDICVLGWELWDIATALEDVLQKTECTFAIVFHSMPFVDALPFPGNYKKDIADRSANETNPMIKKYLIKRSGDAEACIRKFNIISINETVSYYLENYFPGLPFYKAYPGYALDMAYIKNVAQGKKIYDFVFMSKLETSKGIFDLVEIVAAIKKRRSSCTIRVIGDFLYEDERVKLLEQIRVRGLEDMVSFAGWMHDEAKYMELKRCRLFLYPSLTGDTFSFCMLEALACGLGAVCYDTPFARLIYRDAPVNRVEYRNIDQFALMALETLDALEDGIAYRAIQFVTDNYSSWENVALAEERVYERLYRNTYGNH